MMKKSLLVTSSLLLAASTMSAAVPEGELHLLGLNGVTTSDASNLFVAGERDEEDIDEGLWRWTIENVEVTETTGAVTVATADGFTLGFDENNVFGFSNCITQTQGMVYLVEGGPAVNYDLKAGEYTVSLACFEDLDGEGDGDSWILQFVSKNGDADESFYLVGFNGFDSPSASSRFVKVEEEADGETVITYKLPKYHVGECPDGFNVYDAANDVVYGLSPEFAATTPEVNEESPMAFLGAGGENVACKLSEGFYDITFAPMGGLSMISFLPSDDQTPNDELDYYLVGLNDVFTIDDAYKFTRNVVTEEYKDEGGLVIIESVTYTLEVDVQGDAAVTVESANGNVVFGYNSDMAAFMPNNFSIDSPFASLAQNGAPLNCSLPEGKYIFTFAVIDNSTAMISAVDSESGAVEEVEVPTDAATVYYDMQGRQVRNPGHGIYIVKNGAKVSKVAR